MTFFRSTYLRYDLVLSIAEGESETAYLIPGSLRMALLFVALKSYPLYGSHCIIRNSNREVLRLGGKNKNPFDRRVGSPVIQLSLVSPGGELRSLTTNMVEVVGVIQLHCCHDLPGIIWLAHLC